MRVRLTPSGDAVPERAGGRDGGATCRDVTSAARSDPEGRGAEAEAGVASWRPKAGATRRLTAAGPGWKSAEGLRFTPVRRRRRHGPGGRSVATSRRFRAGGSRARSRSTGASAAPGGTHLQLVVDPAGAPELERAPRPVQDPAVSRNLCRRSVSAPPGSWTCGVGAPVPEQAGCTRDSPPIRVASEACGLL